jgi:hypothetical protein
MWAPETGQRLNGRGPVFLIGVGHADPATINMNFSFPEAALAKSVRLPGIDATDRASTGNSDAMD